MKGETISPTPRYPSTAGSPTRRASPQRLIYDLYYLERWGITFDITNILTTAFRVAAHKNAL